jgi:hypothetical protein
MDYSYSSHINKNPAEPGESTSVQDATWVI